MTYCGISKRFYAFNLGSQQRLISSAPDLSLLKPSETYKIGTTENMHDFILESFKVLTFANKLRFRMPWRWSNWSYLY